ncbi:unnamed protein product [Gordionus sp. m RMFG-2023]
MQRYLNLFEWKKRNHEISASFDKSSTRNEEVLVDISIAANSSETLPAKDLYVKSITIKHLETCKPIQISNVCTAEFQTINLQGPVLDNTNIMNQEVLEEIDAHNRNNILLFKTILTIKWFNIV